ncbi:MAG: FG-GAP repeat domain-containing protein, partial [Verrucomicrobiales bacterium]
ARGNSLFLGSEEGGFRDVSIEAGVSIGQWAWSAAFVDFNNDGWQDLIVANGYLTNRRADDL